MKWTYLLDTDQETEDRLDGRWARDGNPIGNPKGESQRVVILRNNATAYYKVPNYTDSQLEVKR